MDTKSFVRRVWQNLPCKQHKEETGKWEMSPGTVWLRQPEMYCPPCGVSWVNGWTWLVNEKKGRVEAIWDGDGNSISLWQAHPHVMNDGTVCTGGFSVIEAITSGFNILSCFCGEDRFHEVMEELGHAECEQMGEREEEDEHEGEMFCEGCAEYIDEEYVSWYDQVGSYLCDNCWREVSVRCDSCWGRFHYPDNGSGDCPVTEVRGGDKFCESCLEDYYLCEECEEYVHFKYMQSNEDEPTCQRCWRDARKECEECPKLVLKTELNDGLCESCWKQREEEAALAGEVEDECKKD